MNSTDLAYAAGFIDGEGSFITTRKRNAAGEMYVRPALQASNCDRAPLDRLAALFGGGVSFKSERGTRREIWTWRVQGERAIETAIALAPYLIVKQQQAALFPLFGSPGRGRGVVPVAELEHRADLARRLKDLNRVGVGS